MSAIVASGGWPQHPFRPPPCQQGFRLGFRQGPILPWGWRLGLSPGIMLRPCVEYHVGPPHRITHRTRAHDIMPVTCTLNPILYTQLQYYVTNLSRSMGCSLWLRWFDITDCNICTHNSDHGMILIINKLKTLLIIVIMKLTVFKTTQVTRTPVILIVLGAVTTT